MDIHSTPVCYRGSHLVNLVEQAQKTARVDKEDFSALPVLRILSHVLHHPISSLSTVAGNRVNITPISDDIQFKKLNLANMYPGTSQELIMG